MPADFPHRTAVAGASLAGTHAAHPLRKLDYDGEIVVASAEKHLPLGQPSRPEAKRFSPWLAEPDLEAV